MISTDENRVVAAVQEWNQNDTYNLYVSEAGGIYYTLALENVMSSMGPEGNVMIDLYEVPLYNTTVSFIFHTVQMWADSISLLHVRISLGIKSMIRLNALINAN